MKQLLFLFLCIALLANCLPEPEPILQAPVDLCGSDHATYHSNNDLMETSLLPEGSEYNTPNGTACGISAVIDQNGEDLLFLVIEVEDQVLAVSANIESLTEVRDFRSVEIRTDETVYEFLDPDFDNYLFIEEFDQNTNRLTGTFNFKLSDESGVTIEVTDGAFDCEFSTF